MFSLCASAVAQVDSDGDGLPDSVETNTGIYVSKTNTGTNPNNPDTDGDNPLSPALRSGPTAGSGASQKSKILGALLSKTAVIGKLFPTP